MKTGTLQGTKGLIDFARKVNINMLAKGLTKEQRINYLREGFQKGMNPPVSHDITEQVIKEVIG